jgi:hypothetical protein
MSRFLSRNKITVITAMLVAFISSGTAAAASYLVLSSTNSASTTTTLRSSVNGSVLALQNTNTVGGTSARGLSISVPSGRAPIVVNSSAGKATNLNADKLDGIDSAGFVRGPVAPWREIGAAGQPSFDCNSMIPCTWANYGGGYNTAAFYKDPVGIVHLKGLIKVIPQLATSYSCDLPRIFTLPAGYRPAAVTIAPTLHNDEVARIDIFPTGEVTICQPQFIATGDWWSLDGISYRASQ